MLIVTDHPSHTDLFDARRSARLSLSEAATLTGRHVRTLQRQESGISPVDIAIYRLYLARAGWMIDSEWSGWSFGQGCLWSPEAISYTPGDLRQLPFLLASLQELRKVLELRNQQPSEVIYLTVNNVKS